MNLSKYDFHHLGYAVNSIEGSCRKLEAVGWRCEHIFEDKAQGVKGMFMECGNSPRIELLENMPGETTLNQFLKLGDFYCYHMGYWTYDIERVISQSRAAGGKQIRPPMPSVAFKGRKICFFAFRAMIVEWIERE